MESSSHRGKLPLLRIQSDWHIDVQNPQNKGAFWVQYTTISGNNYYGKIRVRPNDQGAKPAILFEGEGEFKVLAYDEQELRWIDIQSPDEQVIGHFQSSVFSLKGIHDGKSVNSIHISPQGELGVSGGNDGTLKIWETSTGNVRRDLEGHVGDILTCRFFPSGQVVLSGGCDVQLKIWNALDGTCAATLRGHTGGILDTGFVERGRNVLSCSRDGTARLWECGSQSQVAIISNIQKPINSLCVIANPFPSQPSRTPDSREYGTDGKLVLLACDDATLRGIDLRNQAEVFQLHGPAALTKCCTFGENVFVAGSQEGSVMLWDARNLHAPFQDFKRTEAEITSLNAFTSDQLCVATGDGLFFLWDFKKGKVERDFVGPDYEPVFSAVINGGNAFSVSRDGLIRKYQVPQQST